MVLPHSTTSRSWHACGRGHARAMISAQSDLAFDASVHVCRFTDEMRVVVMLDVVNASRPTACAEQADGGCSLTVPLYLPPHACGNPS